MSVMRHATLAAWQRNEDGSYAADIDGWALRVRWRPESSVTARSPTRGFVWQAERAPQKLAGAEVFEEIEVAMADAEEHVAALVAPADAATDAKAPGDGHGHG